MNVALGVLVLSTALATESPAAAPGPDPAPAASEAPPPLTGPAEPPPLSGPAEPPPLAVPAEAPPAAAPAAEPQPTVDLKTADALYLKALDAWRAGNAYRARQLAAEARAMAGGTHEPAELMEAFALLRLRESKAALEILDRLGNGDPPAEDERVRVAAASTYARYAARQRRDDLSLRFGSLVATRFNGESFQTGLGYLFGVDWPLLELFGVAAEVSAFDTNTRSPVIQGPALDVLGSFHAPVGGGPWALQLKAGPSVWFAGGSFAGTGIAPQLGVRGSLGADIRAWPSVGFAVEVGAHSWPTLAEVLPAWLFTYDLRLSAVVWLPEARSKR